MVVVDKAAIRMLSEVECGKFKDDIERRLEAVVGLKFCQTCDCLTRGGCAHLGLDNMIEEKKL